MNKELKTLFAFLAPNFAESLLESDQKHTEFERSCISSLQFIRNVIYCAIAVFLVSWPVSHASQTVAHLMGIFGFIVFLSGIVLLMRNFDCVYNLTQPNAHYFVTVKVENFHVTLKVFALFMIPSILEDIVQIFHRNGNFALWAVANGLKSARNSIYIGFVLYILTLIFVASTFPYWISMIIANALVLCGIHSFYSDMHYIRNMISTK